MQLGDNSAVLAIYQNNVGFRRCNSGAYLVQFSIFLLFTINPGQFLRTALVTSKSYTGSNMIKKITGMTSFAITFSMLSVIATLGLVSPEVSAHSRVKCEYQYQYTGPGASNKRVLVCRNVVHHHGKRYQ